MGWHSKAGMNCTVDFSAQFGGRDAAAAVLPHFRALKRAAEGHGLDGCPFGELAFIIRADGSVRRFDFEGPVLSEVADLPEFIAVDLSVQQRTWAAGGQVVARDLVRQIKTAVDVIKASDEPRLSGTDFGLLSASLDRLCTAYLHALMQTSL